MRKNMLAHIADENARILSKEINEGVVISTLYGGEKFNLVKISPDREIAINDKFHAHVSPYAIADGRLLFAYADDATRAVVVEKYGMPGEIWNGIRSAAVLTAAAAEIKNAGVSIRMSADSEICGIAVPIPSPNGPLWGALGVFLPLHRCTGENKDKIINAMKRTAQRMSDLLKNQQGAAQ